MGMIWQVIFLCTIHQNTLTPGDIWNPLALASRMHDESGAFHGCMHNLDTSTLRLAIYTGIRRLLTAGNHS